MRVFVAGSTGVLGRALLRRLRARGHHALALVRSRDGEHLVQELGAEPRWGDVFDADSLAGAAEGAEAVVHAATSIPLNTRTRPGDWRENDRLRTEGTRALLDAAARVGASRFVLQSVVGVARPGDGSPFDETSPFPAAPEPVLASMVEGERLARQAGGRSGSVASVAVLRCGWFYGPDAPHTRILAEGLRRRRVPVVGDGSAVLSCLHTEDAASAFVACLEYGRGGLWHVVDDRPVTVADLLDGFARRLNAPTPRRVPVWLARWIAGRQAVQFLTESTRTSNARARADLGWAPEFPSVVEGLDQVVSAWNDPEAADR